MDGIDLVFHAAALKHVPSCETYPFEAYKTNVLGSQNACRTAKAAADIEPLLVKMGDIELYI